MITDADYTDELALISHFLNGATAFLHSLEIVAADIRLNINASKTEFKKMLIDATPRHYKY